MRKSDERLPYRNSNSFDDDDDQGGTLESIARISAPPHIPIEQPQTSDTEILEHLLTRGYDHRVRPPGEDGTINGGPVVVSVNMLLRSISKIDNVNMEYSVQLTFRESWVDKRLSYGVKGDAGPDFFDSNCGPRDLDARLVLPNENSVQTYDRQT
uniref:Neur_chan_LBD domain-containing protein n=1 Tax=Caenorhabditis japonica TaxID=281687 RepID=A0A8R1IMK2_CAEJA